MTKYVARVVYKDTGKAPLVREFEFGARARAFKKKQEALEHVFKVTITEVKK